MNGPLDSKISIIDRINQLVIDERFDVSAVDGECSYLHIFLSQLKEYITKLKSFKTVLYVGGYKFNHLLKDSLRIDMVVELPDADYSQNVVDECNIFIKDLYDCLDSSDIECICKVDDSPSPRVEFKLVPDHHGRLNMYICVYPSQFAAFTVIVRPIFNRSFANKILGVRVLNVDVSVIPLVSKLEKLFSEYPSLSSAVVLLKKWASVRGLMDDNISCNITGFTFSILSSHACVINKLSNTTNAYQIFKCTIKFITTLGNLKSVYLSNSTESTQDSNGRAVISFSLNKSHYVNLLEGLALTFKQLEDYALETTTILTSSSIYTFTQLFGIYMDRSCIYDTSIYISDEASLLTRFTDGTGLTTLEHVSKELTFIIKYGLTDRLTNIHSYYHQTTDTVSGDNESRDTQQVRLNPVSRMVQGIVIYLSFDENIHRRMDIGPGSDSTDSVFYREFWKDRVETRRFADGSINECVLWDFKRGVRVNTNSVDRFISMNNVNLHILETVLRLHGYIANTELKSRDSMKGVHVQHFPLSVDVNINNKWRRSLMSTYNDLNAKLRALDDIPLKIMNIHMCDCHFSYTDVGPSAYEFVDYSSVHPIVIMFESSMAWPDEPVAIEKVKVAFCIAICKELMRLNIKSKVTSDGRMEIYMNGFNFLLSICYNKEHVILTKRLAGYDIDSSKKLTADERMKLQTLWYEYKITEFVRNITLSFPSSSNAVRLAKLWCGLLLIPDCDFLCQLIIAYIYQSNHFMLPTPTSANIGFARFLYILSNYDWENKPLIVADDQDSPSNAMRDDELKLFKIEKKNYSSIPYIWISVSFDPYSLVPNLPNPLLSRRLIHKARSLLYNLNNWLGPPHDNILRNSARGSRKYNLSVEKEVKSQFQSQKSSYDILILLDNIYLKCNNEGYDLLECRVIIRKFISLLKKYLGELAQISYDNYVLMGTTLPPDVNTLEVYLKFIPRSFIPSSSIQPRKYPQTIIDHSIHKHDVHPPIAIPNITLLLHLIITTCGGLVHNVNILN